MLQREAGTCLWRSRGSGPPPVGGQRLSDHLLRCAWSYLRITISDPIPLILLFPKGSCCCPSEGLLSEVLAAVGWGGGLGGWLCFWAEGPSAAVEIGRALQSESGEIGSQRAQTREQGNLLLWAGTHKSKQMEQCLPVYTKRVAPDRDLIKNCGIILWRWGEGNGADGPDDVRAPASHRRSVCSVCNC